VRGALALGPVVQSERLALADAAERIEARGVAAVVRRGEDAGAGGGLPASRMHQVSARAGSPGRTAKASNKAAPSACLTAIFSPPAFLHMTPALDKNTARGMKQNNSKVIR
jgi:hypothetical protein